MPKTAVADIIIPTEFERYGIERTAELSRFGDSGIVEMSPEFDDLAAGGGREVKMPFWKDLTATRQIDGSRWRPLVELQPVSGDCCDGLVKPVQRRRLDQIGIAAQFVSQLN